MMDEYYRFIVCTIILGLLVKSLLLEVKFQNYDDFNSGLPEVTTTLFDYVHIQKDTLYRAAPLFAPYTLTPTYQIVLYWHNGWYSFIVHQLSQPIIVGLLTHQLLMRFT
jgi:hypothetical protein